ncbi:MAG: hypothetical protein V4773_11490 [Verrucomicrobiota bacterium]
MPDRLAELRHQRALVQQQLDWLDGEIAALEKHRASPPSAAPASAAPSPTATVPAVPLSASFPVTPYPVASAPTVPAEVILGEYRTDTMDLQRDVRRGCFLYFAGAFVILGLVVAVLYFTLSAQ